MIFARRPEPVLPSVFPSAISPARQAGVAADREESSQVYKSLVALRYILMAQVAYPIESKGLYRK